MKTLSASATLLLAASLAQGQMTTFTYQGRLDSGGLPASGTYDFRFTVYDASSGGNAMAPPLAANGVAINQGALELPLDFGTGVFTGAVRWLEIAVRTNGPGAFAVLSPRHLVSAAPYALYAASGNPGPMGPQGLTGPVGPKGDKGDPGVAGQPGLQGPAGTNGLNGATGPQGLVGPKGDTGATGATGVTGATGTPGPPGPQGQKGDPGLPGTVGAPGPPGTNGLDGATGPPGPPGPPGSINAWSLTGATGTAPGVNFVGTADDQPLEFKVNNDRVLRLEPRPASSPNIVGGSSANWISPGVSGSTIGGGGSLNWFGLVKTNRIDADLATITGGAGNVINRESVAAAIGGGSDNSIGINSYSGVVAGGFFNFLGNNAFYSTIAGGYENTIGSSAGYSSVGGGQQNLVLGPLATVPGGSGNEAGAELTFAAGHRAKARNQGSFVWADSTDADFVSTSQDQFNVRAVGGVRFETAGAGMTLDGHPVVASAGTGSGLAISTSGGFSDPQLLLKQSNPADWARVRLQAGGPAWDIALSPGAQPVLNFWNGSANVLSLAQNGDATLTGTLSFGTGALRQMLDLWAGQHGIGVQAWATYFRTIGSGANGAFAWYKGGTHADGHLDPGGGETLMRLDSAGLGLSTPSTVNLADANHLIVGPQADANNALSLGYTINNTISAYGIIQAREGGAPTTLQINPFGGQVSIGGPVVSWSTSRNNSLTSDLGGAIELGNSFALSATPYIDFHFGVNGPEDYNVRLINDANNQLTCTGNFQALNINHTSDRNAKEHFAPVDPRQILERVAALPITEWSFKAEPGVRHLGPVAQDFRSAFGVGPDDRHIATVDAEGVALAAIQGLNRRIEELTSELNRRETESAALRQRLDRLEQTLARLASKGAQ